MDKRLRIDLQHQRLDLLQGEELLWSASISSGKAGVGSEEGSGKTPVGRFRIASRHGENAPRYCVFRARVPVSCLSMLDDGDEEDYILTRILTLDGLDEGNQNTRARYIYIHGTSQTKRLGRAASHGCIRLSPDDVLALYDHCHIGMRVDIMC